MTQNPPQLPEDDSFRPLSPSVGWRRRGLSVVAGLCLLLGLGGSAWGVTADELDPMAEGLGHAERLLRLVERVKAAQAEVETMEARFTQVKSSELLLEPESSTGLFYYEAPDRARWEKEKPNPVVMIIRDEFLLTWFVDLERAEKMPIGRYAEQVFEYLGAGSSLQTLMKYFSVLAEFPHEGEPLYYLHLSPRYKRVAKRLQEMDIWVDPESFLPVRFRYVEPNGDETEYAFENLQVNGGVDEELFEIDLPSDVEVRQVQSD